jgi:hypothetical protein
MLLEMDRKGKRADSGWKNEAWVELLPQVVETTPGRYRELLTIEKLKSKEQNIKSLYKDWKWLISQSGFGIHPETRCITGSNEAWEEVIRVSILVVLLV